MILTPVSKKIIAGFLVIGAYFLGAYSVTPEVKRERIEIEKEVIVENDIVRYIERPDGTKETIIDRTKEHRNETVVKEKVETIDRKWLVGLSADVSRDFKIRPNYTLSLDHKVLKNVYLGVYYNTGHAWGISARVSF